MHEGFLTVPGGRISFTIFGSHSSGAPLLVLHGGPGVPHDSLKSLEALADERTVRDFLRRAEQTSN